MKPSSCSAAEPYSLPRPRCGSQLRGALGQRRRVPDRAGGAAGSDWPVSSLNPLEAIEVGITHRSPGDTTAAWNPAERVDLATMIALYTVSAAYAMHQEKETGSIEVGKLADLVVLDRNLFDLPAHRIHEAKVVRTVLEGRTVYRR